LKESEKKN